MQYTINLIRKENFIIMELEGKIIPSSNEDIGEMLNNKFRSICTEGYSRIILDLAGVEFFASNAIGALITGKFTADEFGGKLILWRPKNYVEQSLKMLKLDTILPITSDFSEAEKFVLS